MFESRWYVRVGNLGFNLVALNLLWLLFSGLGLLVLGIFPATAALFSSLRQIIMQADDIPVFKFFFSKFKKEFIQSNLIGYLFLIIGAMLYIDVKFINRLEENAFRTFLMGIIILAILLFFLTLLYIFPIFVHLNLKFWQYPKYALVMAMGRPFLTLMMIIIIAITIYLFMQFIILIPILGISVTSYFLMKIALISLPKN